MNATAGGFVYPFFAVYIRAQGGTSGALAVGGIFAVATLCSAFGRILGGEMADRLGRRQVVLASIAARSTLLVVMAAVVFAEGSLLAVAVPFVLSTVARGAFEPAADAIVADLVAPTGRPRAYATMRIARNAGWAIGPALGGFAGERFALLALAAAALGFVSLMLTARHLAETPHAGAVQRFHPRDLAMALRDRRFRVHCLLTAGLFVLFAQLLVSVSIDLAGRVGLSAREIGWTYTLNGVMVVSLQALVTRAIAAGRPGSMLAWGTLLNGAGFVVLGLGANLGAAMAGVAIFTVGEMVVLPLCSAVAADIAPADRRGRYLGAFGVFVDVGHGLGQVIGGAGLAAAGIDSMAFWWAVAAFSVVLALGFWRFGNATGERLSEAGAAG